MRRVLWAANVRSKPFAERLAAAVAGGFTEMSIFPLDVRRFADAGLPPERLRALAAAQGVRISVLDPYTRWGPDTTPPAWASASDLAFVNFGEDDVLRMAEALGVDSINLIETWGHAVDPDAGAERFAAFADRAAQYGWRTQLECMPFSGIPDLGASWDIVRHADRPTGGLTVDSWHYFRGNRDDALLARIPGARVFQVQLADATWALRGSSLVDDLLHHRLLPGEGEFPLPAFVRTLAATGGLTSVGVELFSDAMDARSAVDVGRLIADGLTATLAGAGVPVGSGQTPAVASCTLSTRASSAAAETPVGHAAGA
jgi:4-hydroxyphenylpyruvate dioxygenase